jgi:hypothetical protein
LACLLIGGLSGLWGYRFSFFAVFIGHLFLRCFRLVSSSSSLLGENLNGGDISNHLPLLLLSARFSPLRLLPVRLHQPPPARAK